ncbi:hypothetical protein [Nonomuraea sp. NPDC049695]
MSRHRAQREGVGRPRQHVTDGQQGLHQALGLVTRARRDHGHRA